MVLVALGLILFRGLELDTSYLYVLGCIVPLASGVAMAMSPMTASIMSAVPARRAGTGSAMNDATREVGAALGVAVLGSLAASRYAHSFGPVLDQVPAASRPLASSSLAGALDAAETLGGAAQRQLTLAAEQAFVDGIHFAVTIGAALALVAAFVALRYLPHQARHESPLEAAEHMAELGLGGVPPSFDEQPGVQPADT